MKWLVPGGSRSGGRVHDRLFVGTPEHSHCGMSGATLEIVTGKPSPGPDKMLAASQMATGASSTAAPLLVTVMMQWIGPPNGAGRQIFLIQMPACGCGTGSGLTGNAGSATVGVSQGS